MNELRIARIFKKFYGWHRVGFIALNGKSAAAKAILVCHFFQFSGCHH